ncbi:DNA helicase, Rad3 [Thioflavicoccus mobilis 8321]|uniref:DNA 5'-3' helicase n=1 Tax=Thioflavicoccus mobilis 8321 TaxID=765912 RepID=L0GY04_9GAMM|nr:ATP-dependent DNA helicase [Thioflavicoccus mobilis]AGA90851.1 DNA helicase, Rad3 [Thioflavicoccus mobilis 8321]
MDDLAAILGPDGLLCEHLPGFGYRSQQEAMAEAVAETLADGGVLVCEAGTGTGKTFAYLVPALLSGRKVLISTGTRNLQDQLFHRDLPRIRKLLHRPVDIALLKGRANYLCRYRLKAAEQDERLVDPQWHDELARVQEWAVVTRRGDIAEAGLPEEARIWPTVTSTSDNCLGQDCPDWGGCHLVEARRRAQEADLVVVNHHLLCADLALKDEGFGEILPGVDCVIVDEAHQLPEIASGFFGLSLSGRQLMDLARDVELEQRREASDTPALYGAAGELRGAVQGLRLALGEADRRGPWQALEADRAIVAALERLAGCLDGLRQNLDALAGRGKGLDSCLARCAELSERLTALSSGGGEDVRWFETQGRGLRLHQTPLEVANQFETQFARGRVAWIFTSATLAVGDDFGHFIRRLGIPEPRTERWESPFDYPRQALWYVPTGLPDPSSHDYTRAVVELAVEVLTLSRGRAFLLFTSHRALREAAALLETRLPFPLLVQGSAPRAELVARFSQLGNAVLLGSASFWEGVDVRGEALSCVLIDKLPFASPGDPVMAARIDALRRRGGNPFQDFQLPQAVIALKQGAGRLIRDVTDRGALVVCDPRLLARSYGRRFLESLPPMARTRDPAHVAAFFGGSSGAGPATGDPSELDRAG